MGRGGADYALHLGGSPQFLGLCYSPEVKTYVSTSSKSQRFLLHNFFIHTVPLKRKTIGKKCRENLHLKFDNEERAIYLEKLYGANGESVKMDEFCVGITDNDRFFAEICEEEKESQKYG